MHELSIAISLVEATLEEATRLDLSRVEAVHVEVGVLSGVVEEALRQSFELACQGTPLAGSRLVVEEVPVSIVCPACGTARPVRSLQRFACATCGAPAAAVVGGRELRIVALEVPS